MISLQELITRGRFLLSDAPERLRLFQLVNGRLSTHELASATNRHVNNVRRDLTALANAGLIQQRISESGPMTRNGFPLWEKVPLAREIPTRYFSSIGPRPAAEPSDNTEEGTRRKSKLGRGKLELTVPSESEILAIAKNGEDQLHEFKAPGVEARKITRELAAMLNTKRGGMVLYGIDDDCNILGSDMSRQKIDQPIQNSVRSSIFPSAMVRLHSVPVVGSEVIVMIAPPWNRRDIYQFDEKVLIRKGTNVFGATPDELRRMHEGEAIA
jgi:predicted HTH transcriptional regulator